MLVGIYGLCAGGHTYSSDEEGMLATTEAILERRSPELVITDDNSGMTPRTEGRNGAPVGVSGLGQSVVGMPLYLAGSVAAETVAESYENYTQRVFVGFTNSFVTAAGVVLVFLIGGLLGASRRAAIALALVYGLGTMAWPHAKTFFSEPLTTTMVLAATWLALRAARDHSLRLCAAAGAAAGAALFARSTAGLFLPVLGVYLLAAFWAGRDLRRPLAAGTAFTAGAVPLLALLGASNWWRFGSPTSFGPKSIPLDYPILEGLYGLFLSPGKSLFLYAPAALVGLAAVPFSPSGRRRDVALVTAVGLVNALFFARFLQWHGDHAWGPRYLIMSVPFLILPVAPLLGRIKWRRALLAAGAVGFGTAALGTAMYFNQYFHIVERALPPLEIGPAGPTYWESMHYDPYWSPVAGHLRALPDIVRNTTARLDGEDDDLQRFPDTPGQRYGWYFAPPQFDSWAYWLFPAHGPKKLLLLVPLFAAALVVGARRLWPALR